MGANAVTSVPTYVAGQVLDASRLNVTNSGAPVFATTVERDAAFGGSGEKVLAEGQLAYIEASNVVQYYDGAAWATVGPTAPGGLVTIANETSVSGSTTFTLDNCFTSTYTNYLLVGNLSGATAGNITLQLRVGGVTTSTNYNYQSADASGASFAAARTTSASSIRLGIADTDFRSTFMCQIMQPQLAHFTTFMSEYVYTTGASTTDVLWANYYGIQSASTAFDGFIVTTSGGNFTGTYSLYGYAK